MLCSIQGQLRTITRHRCAYMKQANVFLYSSCENKRVCRLLSLRHQNQHLPLNDVFIHHVDEESSDPWDTGSVAISRWITASQNMRLRLSRDGEIHKLQSIPPKWSGGPDCSSRVSTGLYACCVCCKRPDGIVDNCNRTDPNALWGLKKYLCSICQ